MINAAPIGVTLDKLLVTTFTPILRGNVELRHRTGPRSSVRRRRSEDPDSCCIGLYVHTGNVAFANIPIKPIGPR